METSGTGKRGGYRPGAGRPRTTIKARVSESLILQLERRAASFGCSVPELAGYMLRQAMEGNSWPVTAREVTGS